MAAIDQADAVLAWRRLALIRVDEFIEMSSVEKKIFFESVSIVCPVVRRRGEAPIVHSILTKETP
jgi:hypothetical protein